MPADAACRDALRRQQPPYRRELLQGPGAGACARRSRSIRARAAACPRPRARSEGCHRRWHFYTVHDPARPAPAARAKRSEQARWTCSETFARSRPGDPATALDWPCSCKRLLAGGASSHGALVLLHRLWLAGLCVLRCRRVRALSRSRPAGSRPSGRAAALDRSSGSRATACRAGRSRARAGRLVDVVDGARPGRGRSQGASRAGSARRRPSPPLPRGRRRRRGRSRSRPEPVIGLFPEARSR